MLRVENLTKRFGSVNALQDVSFEVDEGEVVGLLGENGAGKTTTLRLLSGALFPTSGRVSIADRDLFAHMTMTRRKVGYLPEKLPLDDSMRVTAYLDYVGRLRGMSRAERAAGIERVVSTCGLTELARRGIGVLSRGGRMRVGLAQALIHNPELLLLDEPTAGLDPQQVLNMRELILSLAGHHTILFSSHNLTEVAACCSRIMLLRDGRLAVSDGMSRLGGSDEETLVMRFSTAPTDHLLLLSAMHGVLDAAPLQAGAEGAVSVRLQAGSGVREQLVEQVTLLGWGLCELRPVEDQLSDLFAPEEVSG